MRYSSYYFRSTNQNIILFYLISLSSTVLTDISLSLSLSLSLSILGSISRDLHQRVEERRKWHRLTSTSTNLHLAPLLVLIAVWSLSSLIECFGFVVSMYVGKWILLVVLSLCFVDFLLSFVVCKWILQRNACWTVIMLWSMICG